MYRQTLECNYFSLFLVIETIYPLDARRNKAKNRLVKNKFYYQHSSQINSDCWRKLWCVCMFCLHSLHSLVVWTFFISYRCCVATCHQCWSTFRAAVAFLPSVVVVVFFFFVVRIILFTFLFEMVKWWWRWCWCKCETPWAKAYCWETEREKWK